MSWPFTLDTRRRYLQIYNTRYQNYRSCPLFLEIHLFEGFFLFDSLLLNEMNEGLEACMCLFVFFTSHISNICPSMVLFCEVVLLNQAAMLLHVGFKTDL